MMSYLVHLPKVARPGSADGLERMVLVKDRFHWLAFLVPLVWLLVNRLWLAFLALLAVGVLLGAGGPALGLHEAVTVAIELLLALGVGVFAADLKSRGLVRRGLPLAGVATGRDEEEAMRRFTDRWLAGAAPALPGPTAPASPTPRRPLAGSTIVGGLFPRTGRA
jgi:hypothetical protein